MRPFKFDSLKELLLFHDLIWFNLLAFQFWWLNSCQYEAIAFSQRPVILQKQPPRGAPRKRCSENMQQIYRRTPMPKRNFHTHLGGYFFWMMPDLVTPKSGNYRSCWTEVERATRTTWCSNDDIMIIHELLSQSAVQMS